MNITDRKPIVKKEFSEATCQTYAEHYMALSHDVHFSHTRRQGYVRISKAFTKRRVGKVLAWPTLRQTLQNLDTEYSAARQIIANIEYPGPMLESIEEMYMLAAQAEAIARFLNITYQERKKKDVHDDQPG